MTRDEIEQKLTIAVGSLQASHNHMLSCQQWDLDFINQKDSEAWALLREVMPHLCPKVKTQLINGFKSSLKNLNEVIKSYGLE